jgi:hypothetical protein
LCSEVTLFSKGDTVKKKTLKLKLAKETIATLDEISLEAARGGYYTPETYCCPSKTGPTMCYCPVIERAN